MARQARPHQAPRISVLGVRRKMGSSLQDFLPCGNNPDDPSGQKFGRVRLPKYWGSSARLVRVCKTSILDRFNFHLSTPLLPGGTLLPRCYQVDPPTLLPRLYQAYQTLPFYPAFTLAQLYRLGQHLYIPRLERSNLVPS